MPDLTQQIEEAKRLMANKDISPLPWSNDTADGRDADCVYEFIEDANGAAILDSCNSTTILIEDLSDEDGPYYIDRNGRANASAIVAVVNLFKPMAARLKECEGKLEEIEASWDRVAGFAVCESCGPERRYRITIDYPTLEKAQDAYSAIAEITNILNRTEKAGEK